MGKKRKGVGIWKPVGLSKNLVANGIENLVGIEELVDYSIVRNNVIQSTCKRKKKKKKVDPLQGEKRKQDNQENSSKRRKVHITCQQDNEEEEVIKHIELKRNKQELESNVAEENESYKLLDKMPSWNGLGVHTCILQALAEQEFTCPTEIQAKTLPSAILGRRDILGAAETGSGKTLAFGIPILHRILEDKTWNSKSDTNENIPEDSDIEEEDDEIVSDSDEVDQVSEPIAINCESSLYALVLTPTRELAMQVHNHLVAAAKYTGIKIAVIVGGMASQKQERLLNRAPEIVVATPGRLWELIQFGNPHLAQISSIKCLAIDETDRMLEKGHFQELHNLLEMLNAEEGKKKQRQNFVFSATLTMVHDAPRYIKGKNKKLKVTPGQKLQNIMTMLGVTNPKVVDVTRESGVSGTLTEGRIICTLQEKDFYLYYFIQRHRGRTLIFCNSISCVRRLAQILTLLQCRPLPLHANMVQRQRLKNLDRFREDPSGLLLATDVAARGLDIPGVQHVIHYQVPRTSEIYVHRSGRTARAQKEGISLLLIEPTEVPYYSRLCRTLGKTKELPLFPVEPNALAVVKQRVVLARELDQLELSTRRFKSESGWFQKSLAAMDMLVEEEEEDDDLPRADNEDNKLKKAATVKRKQLKAMLSKPLFVSDDQLSQQKVPQHKIVKVKNAIEVLKSTVNPRKPQHKTKKPKFKKKKKKLKNIE